VEHFGEGDSDSQPREAARADGNVELLDVGGFLVEWFEEISDGGEDFRAVSQGSGEGGVCEEFGAESESDGADSAGSFDGKDEGS